VTSDSSRSPEAARLVRCAYRVLDLFAGRRDDLLAWSRTLGADRSVEALTPSGWAPATAATLRAELSAAAVADPRGRLDPLRLAQLQSVVELLPHLQDAEQRRRPDPKPRVVFTLPPGVVLPERAGELARRTLAVRILDALGSATERVLLASPFWSEAGADALWPGLERALALDIPITLAGARDDPSRGDLEAMLALAKRLHDAGGSEVRALRYQSPHPYSLFHGKLVCGRRGYLGSANLTASGLGEHLEAGIPLDQVDVGQVWWLLGVLIDAGLLVEHPQT
jgi:hypothetical protein